MKSQCRRVAHRLAFGLLLTGGVAYHYALSKLLPPLVALPESLSRGYGEVIGFDRLDGDLAAVKRLAESALRDCDYTVDCRRRGLLQQEEGATYQDYQDHSAAVRGIGAAFRSSLKMVSQVCSDRYLGSEALAPFASRLDAVGANASVVGYNLAWNRCSETAPRLCAARSDAIWLAEEAPRAHAMVQEALGSGPMPALRELGSSVLALHLVPWALGLAAVYFLDCWPPEIRGCVKGDRPPRLLAVVHHLLWFVVCFVLSLSAVLAAEVLFQLGVVSLPWLPGGPALSEVLVHLSVAFPELWRELAGWVDPGAGRLDLRLLLSALAALLAVCLLVAADVLAVALHRRWSRSIPVTYEDLAREILSSDFVGDLEAELAELQQLSPCQLQALGHVRARCRKLHTEALPHLRRRVLKLGFCSEDLSRLLAWIRELAPIIVHVDLEKYGWPLAADTHYRSQFETGTSGGTLSRRKRATWEDALFGGAYCGSEPSERCKYGVLNVINDPQGVCACWQYGSSYLLLRGVRLRTTLAATDSAGIDTDQLATVDFYAHVLDRYDDQELRHALQVGAGKALGTDSRVLTTYKEAQVHGDLQLGSHVELIMAHPAVRLSCSGEEMLKALALRCTAPFVWIEGAVGPAQVGRSEESDVEAAVRASMREYADATGIAVGGLVSVNGRLGRVSWDGRPENDMVKVFWEADGVESHYISVREVSPLAPAAPPFEAPPFEETWEVEVDDAWLILDAAALAAIAGARAEGRRVATFRARGFAYTLDLVRGVQTNCATGKCRRARPVAGHPLAPTPPEAESTAPGPDVRSSHVCAVM